MTKTRMRFFLAILLAGCQPGARYRGAIHPDGTFEFDVTVNNNSEFAGAKLGLNPETGKVIGFSFSKKGTDSTSAIAAWDKALFELVKDARGKGNADESI